MSIQAPPTRFRRTGEIPSAEEATARCLLCIPVGIFVLIVTVILAHLEFKGATPTISIEQFYVPALNMTSNVTLTNHSIFFDLKLNNNNYNKDYQKVSYGALNVTLYYARNLSFPVANVFIPGFLQGFFKVAHRTRMVTTIGVPWEIAQNVVVLNGTDVFRVELNTSLRLKRFFGDTKHHSVIVGGNVRVNDQGNMVKHKKKGVKLSATTYLQVGYVAYSYGLVTFLLLSV